MSITPVSGSLVFIVGLCVGSFLNVCVWRLPAEEQVVKGRSICRSCRHEIPWYDNIPLISFTLLRGECRFCKAKISWLYPFVELVTGLLFVGVAIRFGFTAQAAVYAALGASLILISVVDAREMIIPDEVTKPGLWVGIVLSFLVPFLHRTGNRWEGLLAGLLGAAVGAGFVYGIGVAGRVIFHRKLKAIGEEEAMGFGDVKLMGMVGALIGWQKVLLVNLFFAPLLGTVVGIISKLRYHKDLIPYGPFLSLGTLLVIFWGDQVLEW